MIFHWLLILSILQISSSQLIIKPSESIILHDQFKSFVASCTGQPNTRVATWRSPSQVEIEEDDTARISVEHQNYGLRLRIRNLTRADQGIWECLGTNQDGTVSRSIQINVKVPITFFAEPIQYAEIQSTVLIKCRVLANPSAEVSWFKGRDKTRLLSSNYERTNDGLKIHRVTSADNDLFWCQADVLETGESKDYPIQVIIAQPITTPKIVCASPCAVEKQTATLICEAAGMPPPQYLWFYGVQDLPIASNAVSKFITRGNTLIINYADETDNGRYSCQAFNDYDRRGQRTDYLLNVVVPPRLAPIPSININLDDNSPPQRAIFTCRVLRGSAESLTLEWILNDGSPVQPINGISINVNQLSLNHLIELKFEPIRREHHGNYTCLAKNLADITSTVANLFVEYRPVFLGPLIPFVFSVPNYRAIMKCQFDSFPEPQIQWVKMIRTPIDPEFGHVLIQDNDPQVIDILTRKIGPTIYETQLTFNPSENDFGLNFECRAINPRVGRYSINLRLAEVPRQVRVVKVEPRSNMIQLNIQPPLETGGLPLTEYIVKYEQIGLFNSVKTETFPIKSEESQTLRLESLQASSSYRIQILAKSRAGEGILSIPYQLRTLDRHPPQFKIISSDPFCLSDQSCSIKWIVEGDGGSPISRAEISFGKMKNPTTVEDWSPSIQIDPLQTEFEFNSLQPNTQYMFLVRLFNEAGVGEQRIQRATSKSRIDSRSQSTQFLNQRRFPGKLIISLFVGCIILVVAISIGIFLIFRCKSNRNESSSKSSNEQQFNSSPEATILLNSTRS